jgi:hypothetical protein
VRRYVIAALICATALLVMQPTAASAAAPASRPNCPPCAVAAGIGIEEIVTGGLIAGAIAGGTAVAVHNINKGAAHAERIVRHPNKFRHAIRLAKAYRTDGRAIWKAAGKSLKGLARWTRRHVGIKQIKKNLPDAAWACGVSGVTVYLLTFHVRAARDACIGAFVATAIRGKRKQAGEWAYRPAVGG